MRFAGEGGGRGRNKLIAACAGLERVAEEMMGSKRWNRMTQLENGRPRAAVAVGANAFLPAAALEEQLQLVDWVPDQVCHFCDAQRLPVSRAAPRGRPLMPLSVCRSLPDHRATILALRVWTLTNSRQVLIRLQVIVSQHRPL